MTLLERLAELIRVRSGSRGDIMDLALHPATIGHLREFDAPLDFEVDLVSSGSGRRFRGRFRSGSLAGRSVEVKSCRPEGGRLEIKAKAPPADYLVLAGPGGRGVASDDRPWVIERVFLFDVRALSDRLREQGVPLGKATRIPPCEWEAAEVYPEARNPSLVPDEGQRRLLGLFSDDQRLQ